MRDPDEQESNESLQEAIDPHRREERDAASVEVAARLRARGIALTGRESSEELVDLLDSVERFERAVERHGGDLMVDEGPHGTTREPDDGHFVLPERAPQESVGSYRARVDERTSELRRHARRPGTGDRNEPRP
jgi:hypothetical protein